MCIFRACKGQFIAFFLDSELVMVRSLRNESEDPDHQKERQDSSPTKRDESAERNEFEDPDPQKRRQDSNPTERNEFVPR
ncbi:hypothetical protein AVEN_240900-1 [Araneus ventricosus]|uniref:Uncharacterized protein n=1 Tax=Araneus ventricosus TaxID=182803 RepID=A0A4Y2JYP9_ARAVE|nr:hypothetical protein AVEN_240900-1 [Araneus ventricosus]